MEPVVSNLVKWIYGEPPLIDQSGKMFMLTQNKIAIIGTWANCVGVIAWFPLPDRDKNEEQRRGL